MFQIAILTHTIYLKRENDIVKKISEDIKFKTDKKNWGYFY